ncbi:MAG TPA: C-terminal helicase domain-containing protein, partial [Chthonomonadaceae bacterium]|nr:C-terminal helicase domain-containing protein [Chthonomonadaceae bacterium]
QSQRTAQYLEGELRARLNARVARIDSHVETSRAAILHGFSPSYNARPDGGATPKPIDLLVCTDVLSEGVNLQEADVVLSYDVHWNPVRLIQRIGRVDRRLRPELPESRTKSFEIINILPPDEIDKIINLVGTIENRTLRISNALGLDMSFFKEDDPAGNLKEFNATVEGSTTRADEARNSYARLGVEPPDAKTRDILAQLPPGAFGVWCNAPLNGLFALFQMAPKPEATAADKSRFAAVIGRPVLILDRGDGTPAVHDAGEILVTLGQTVPGAKSGDPSDEAALAKRLKALKDRVRQSFAEINLPGSIVPQLVCWMELRTV